MFAGEFNSQCAIIFKIDVITLSCLLALVKLLNVKSFLPQLITYIKLLFFHSFFHG